MEPRSGGEAPARHQNVTATSEFGKPSYGVGVGASRPGASWLIWATTSFSSVDRSFIFCTSLATSGSRLPVLRWLSADDASGLKISSKPSACVPIGTSIVTSFVALVDMPGHPLRDVERWDLDGVDPDVGQGDVQHV